MEQEKGLSIFLSLLPLVVSLCVCVWVCVELYAVLRYHGHLALLASVSKESAGPLFSHTWRAHDTPCKELWTLLALASLIELLLEPISGPLSPPPLAGQGN